MHSHIVQELWKRSGDGVGFIAYQDRKANAWTERGYNWYDKVSYKQNHKQDVYFSPLTFNTRRLNTDHKPPTILFADLDPVHPETVDPVPHIAWATSRGMYQAVWLLDEPVKYSTQWHDLNRRMTYHTGADKGGWSASKVLRIPGSINYKRMGETGTIMWEEYSDPYTFEELDSNLMPLAEIKQVSGEAPPLVSDRAQLDAMWDRLSASLQYRLIKKNVKDRSTFIVSTAHLMCEAGVPKEDAFHMLWYAPFNKWRHRNNPNRLWIELSHVYSKPR